MLSSLERSTITKAPSREMFISDEKKRSPLEKGDLTQLIIFRARYVSGYVFTLHDYE